MAEAMHRCNMQKITDNRIVLNVFLLFIYIGIIVTIIFLPGYFGLIVSSLSLPIVFLKRKCGHLRVTQNKYGLYGPFIEKNCPVCGKSF